MTEAELIRYRTALRTHMITTARIALEVADYVQTSIDALNAARGDTGRPITPDDHPKLLQLLGDRRRVQRWLAALEQDERDDPDPETPLPGIESPAKSC